MRVIIRHLALLNAFFYGVQNAHNAAIQIVDAFVVDECKVALNAVQCRLRWMLLLFFSKGTLEALTYDANMENVGVICF